MPSNNISRLSVVVINWNTADITCQCLKSIHQHLPVVEIVVVDNASTDDSVIKIRKLINSFQPKADPPMAEKISNFKLKINPSNLGYSKACNAGAKLAKGDYLLFLNSDIELIDDSIVLMLNFLKNNPPIGAIGPKFLNLDKSPQASVFPDQSILNAIKEFWLKFPSFQKYLPSGQNPVDVFAVSGGAILMPRSAFQKVCTWNENYFFYYEDLDLCRSLHRLGFRVVFFPAACLVHHHGASGKNLTDSSNQWRRLIRSSLIYHGFLKHYIINLIIWSGQKFEKILDVFS